MENGTFWGKQLILYAHVRILFLTLYIGMFVFHRIQFEPPLLHFLFLSLRTMNFFFKFLHPNFRCPCKLINLGHTDETNWFPIRIKRRSLFSSYIDGANIFLNGCYLMENLANLNFVSHLYYPALNPLFPWDCLLNWHETWKIEYWLITMQVAGH